MDKKDLYIFKTAIKNGWVSILRSHFIKKMKRFRAAAVLELV